MSRSLFLLCLSFCSLINQPVRANDADYLRELIQTAEQQQLAARPEWLKLVHYKPQLLPGVYKSQVDAPRFFNAPDGKHNPQSELAATLSAFFAELPADPEQHHLHPQCLFPARYQWLRQELQFNAQRLPEFGCRRLEEWLTALNPAGLTLIFPTSYINSPASMFGHTLLRVDTPQMDEQTSLLAYAINFTANTGNDGGFAYAFKGLLGGYPGSFSVLPYYLKVREYSDMENRDIWEYRLHFNDAEVHRILLHTWELRGIWFDYFFFDENCSYHLLSLLETGRTSLNLTDHFGAWAIPSDTVRVVEQAGLIDEVTFRPSRHAKLVHRLNKQPEASQQTAVRLGSGELSSDAPEMTGLPMNEQAEIIELAHEYAAYNKDEIDETQRHHLLVARSRLPVQGNTDAPAPPVQPEHGHPTARINLAVGRETNQSYQQLELRPAYHDLLDPDAGYTQGAEIAFFELGLRYVPETDSLRLEKFIPVNIVSLTPVSTIDSPLSWRLNFGLIHKQGQQFDRPMVSINAGLGKSWAPFEQQIAYAMLIASIDADHRELEDGYALGGGVAVGIVQSLTPRWALHFGAESLHYSSGDRHNEHLLKLEQRFTINESQTARMEWRRQQQLADEISTLQVSWQWYR